jgi:hypothetical protein
MFNPSPKFKRSARRLALLALPCLALVAAAPASTTPKVASSPKVASRPKVTPTPTRTTANLAKPPTGTTTNAATPPTNAVANQPPQGLYEECAPSNQQQCASELAQMGTAGFRLALNYTAWYGSATDIQAYASAAQAQGIKLIWPLNSLPWHSATSLATTYPALAASCGACTTNDSIRRYAVNLVRSLPATWGYYIGDEEASSVAPAVAALAGTVRAIDPDPSHQLLYVGQSNPTVATNLEPFMSSANVIGADVYPIGEGQPTSAVGPIAAKVSQLASAAGKKGAMVLQAFSWTQYPTEIAAINPRWPTETDMHQMLEQAVAANPSMILWYNLSDIQRSDNPAQHWQDLVTAAFGSPTTTTGSSPTGPTTTSTAPTTTSTGPTTTTPSTARTSSTPSTTSTPKTSTTSSPTTSLTSSTTVHGTGPAAKKSSPKSNAAHRSKAKPKPTKRSKAKAKPTKRSKAKAKPRKRSKTKPKPKPTKR